MIDEDCTCDFDYPEPDGEESWHYARTCRVCGVGWGALHCVHESVQNPCPSCGWVDPGTRTPLSLLFPRLPRGVTAMTEAQRKILAEMTRTAAADGHYDTVDEFVQTRGDDSPEEFFKGVDLDAMPRWKTADDLAALSIDAFARQQAPCEDASITDYHESAERDIHGNRL